jgi:low affinity Fe/Cu permease
MNETFRKIAHGISSAMGSSWAFILAVIIVLGWAISGPFFGYSESWQLFINTGTTILTFLMVFLIQNTQNRDSKALHLKMDELIYKVKNARNRLIDLEDMPDSELEKLEREFEAIQKRQQKRRKKIKKIRRVAKKVL